MLGTKAEQSALHAAVIKAKDYDEASAIVDNQWTGEQELAEIVRAIESRDGRTPVFAEMEQPSITEPVVVSSAPPSVDSEVENRAEGLLEAEEPVKTPQCSHSPDPALLRAPLAPANESRMPLPAFVSGRDAPTPTPIPAPIPPPISAPEQVSPAEVASSSQ